MTTVKMVVEICHQFWWIFLGPNKPPTLVAIIHHTGMVAYYHHIWWFHVMLKNETLYMFFLYNMTLLPMADVYSMMHCHFMSTCGILCLCTFFVFFHAFLLSLQCPPPPTCALHALSDILLLPTTLCVLGGCGCACVDVHACVWINYVCMCPQLMCDSLEWNEVVV